MSSRVAWVWVEALTCGPGPRDGGPGTMRDIVAAFELAWNRASPHAEYKPD